MMFSSSLPFGCKISIKDCRFSVSVIVSHRQSGVKNLDALFGKARSLMLQHNYGLALDLMNQAVVMVSNYLPAIIEKMKIQLAMNDWEQVVDTAQRSEFKAVSVNVAQW